MDITQGNHIEVLEMQFAEVIEEPEWEAAELITVGPVGERADLADQAQDHDFLTEMPIISLLRVKDAGALDSCSWHHAEKIQPFLAFFVELNGGSPITYRP